MKEKEKQQLVSAWIAAQNAQENSSEREKNYWAISKLFHLTIDDPETSWDVIIQIHNSKISESVRGSLAAGPLEDLLVDHGQAYIGQVRNLAKQDQLFKQTLKGVWLDCNDNPICEEFYQIAGIDPPFPKGWE